MHFRCFDIVHINHTESQILIVTCQPDGIHIAYNHHLVTVICLNNHTCHRKIWCSTKLEI